MSLCNKCFGLTSCLFCRRCAKEKEKGEYNGKQVGIKNVCPQIGEGRIDVKHWLTLTVNLGEYVDNFLKNGFETLETVKMIEDDDILKQIGINKVGHILMLMNAIEELRKQQ